MSDTNRILRLPDDVLERLLAGYKDRINLPLKERRAQWNKELGEALREYGIESPFTSHPELHLERHP